jgi:hypothetical protein
VVAKISAVLDVISALPGYALPADDPATPAARKSLTLTYATMTKFH